MRLKSFRNKPGTVLDAFSDATGEHLGTIMVVELPPIFQPKAGEHRPEVPVVLLKQALPIKHHSRRLPRGSVGLWSDCLVMHVT